MCVQGRQNEFVAGQPALKKIEQMKSRFIQIKIIARTPCSGILYDVWIS